MLTVSVQKDIGEYEEKVVLGMTAKRLGVVAVCVALAIVIGLVGRFVFEISIENLAIPIFLTTALGFLVGYVEPLNMPFLDALPYLIRQNFGLTKLSYSSAAEMALDEYEKEQDSKATRKASNVRKEEVKEYNRIRTYRGIRSSEYLLPRYLDAKRAIDA